MAGAVEVSYIQTSVTGDLIIEPDGVSLSNGESLELYINNEQARKVSAIKRALSLTVKGVVETSVTDLETERTAAVESMLGGSFSGADITIFGLTLQAAYVTEVTPSNIIIINGTAYGDAAVTVLEGVWS